MVTSPRHPNTYNSYNVGPTYVGNMESGNDEGQIGPRNSFGGYFKVGSNLKHKVLNMIVKKLWDNSGPEICFKKDAGLLDLLHTDPS